MPPRQPQGTARGHGEPTELARGSVSDKTPRRMGLLATQTRESEFKKQTTTTTTKTCIIYIFVMSVLIVCPS